MKFLRLDLLAYGHFTNRSLVLPSEGPNLHIVYGHNEAGKSTTLRAISGLLFGIEKNTGDAHQHSMSDLRIGATVRHSSGVERSFIRRKGNTGTLLDGHGTSVDEAQLRSWLSITDRKHFEQMFGLSHEQLRAAGEALADAKTAAGEALFGAALNGTALGRTRKQLDEEADRLFSPRSSTAAVNKALNAFRDQRKKVSEHAVLAKDWSTEQRDREAADVALSECSQQLIEAQARCRRLERLQKALPWLRRRAEALRARTDLGDVHLVPADTASRRRQLEQALRDGEDRLTDLNAKLRDLENERAALQVPDAFLAARSDIQPLTEQLGKYRSEKNDRPGVVRGAVDHSNHQKAILRELGLPDFQLADIEQIRPEESFRKYVRALDKQGVKLADQCAQQRSRLAEISAAIMQCTQKLGTLPVPRDVHVLRLTWQRIQADQSLDAQIRTAETRITQEDLRVTAALHALAPWTGPLETVMAWSLPSDDALRRAEEEIRAFDQTLAQHQRERQLRVAAIDDLENRARALADGEPIPTEEQLLAHRARRDEGWRRLLSAWARGENPLVVDSEYAEDRRLADAYFVALQSADQIADALRRQSDRVASHELLQRELRDKRAQLATFDTEIAETTRRSGERQDAWRSLWSGYGIEPGTPAVMREWRNRHLELVGIVQSRQESIVQRDHLRTRWHDFREAIDAALAMASASLPAETPWPTLLAHVEHILQESEQQTRKTESLQQQLTDQTGEAKRLESLLAVDEKTLSSWEEQWRAAMTRLRLGPEVRGNEVDAVLDKLDALFKAEDLRQTLEARLRAIDKQKKAFEDTIAGLAKDFAPSHTGQTDEIADVLIALHGEGTRTAERRDALDKQLRQLKTDIDAATSRHDNAQRHLDDLLRETGCPSKEALALAEERSAEVRKLDEQREQAEQRLDEIREDWSLEALADAAADADSDQLAAEISNCEAEIKVLAAKHQESMMRAGALAERSKRFAGGPDAALLQAEAFEQIAAARSQAERYATLRIATILLQRAVDSYREKNQGTILRRASELFRQLTLGRYENLQLVDTDGGPRLRCSRQGQLVEVERALSDGTLDQLFLSLRLASLEQHLDSQEPMPMVLDDIFIHFDDSRTEAGLRVLAEFATKTQVLLLTHHARNLDLARRTLASNQWSEHTLGEVAVAAGG